ncbi:MAG: DUF2007 domain-containing protein [Chloroflexi bacterium]|nr:DUF2007 domain-containing protein [Chloroflexota bacterium]
MPKTIRIRADQVVADLAAQRLESEGIPVRVISDSDFLGVAGTPMAFSLLVPAQYEERARAILSELEQP